MTDQPAGSKRASSRKSRMSAGFGAAHGIRRRRRVDRSAADCRGLVKSFAAVQALRAVDFRIRCGPRPRTCRRERRRQVDARQDHRRRLSAGCRHDPTGRSTGPLHRRRRRACAQRIVTVHQDINLVQTMTVAENLLLNNEPTYGFGIIRRRDMRDKVPPTARSLRDRRRPRRDRRRTAERSEEDGADRQGGVASIRRY